MKPIEYVKQHEEYEVGYVLRASFIAGFLTCLHKQDITNFHEKCPDKELSIRSDGIEINHADRKELVAFLTSFGGDWQKEVEDYYPDKMRYFRKCEVDGFTYELKAGCVPPPPSCKIVEEEVEVPAHKETKKKIVCQEGKDLVEELTTEQAVV
jgi:hypothetical protein